MNKQTYLTAMKRALTGLPTDQVDDILRDYEQHFIDATSSGRDEEEIARALGDPRKIALEFKAVMHLDAFQQKRSLGNFARLLFTLLCMVGFNLFLLPFAVIMPLMLFSFYLMSAGCFIGGMLIAASGLSGVDKIVLQHSETPMVIEVIETEKSTIGINASDSVAVINLYPYGIRFRQEYKVGISTAAGNNPTTSADIQDQSNAPAKNKQSQDRRKALFGAAYFAGSVVLFWLCRKFGKYLWIGVVRYVRLNVKLLRDARKSQI